MDISKMLAYGRIPIFLDALMQVPCRKAYVIGITLITFKMIHNALIVDYIRLLLLWPKNLLNRFTAKDRLNVDTYAGTQGSELLLYHTRRTLVLKGQRKPNSSNIVIGLGILMKRRFLPCFFTILSQ